MAIAHRGGAEEAPENTLAAFQGALTLGYRFLETDVHVSRDGCLVAFHDVCLDRITDRQGAICELDLAEVRAADAGYSYTPDAGRTFPFRGHGIRVPLLAEILERWPQAYVSIDPKCDECVRPLVSLLDRLCAWQRVCIGSFAG